MTASSVGRWAGETQGPGVRPHRRQPTRPRSPWGSLVGESAHGTPVKHLAQDRRNPQSKGWESLYARENLRGQELQCISGFPSLCVGGCAGNPWLEAEESRASELALHWPTAAPRGFVWNRSLRFLLYFKKSLKTR